MSEAAPRFVQNVADLRQAFDQAFAIAAQPSVSDIDAFLAIRVAGRPFVMRVAELRRLENGRKIVPLPGGPQTLLGLAGIQGRLTPVYSLAGILGLDTPAAARRWIVVCAGEDPLGLAFDEFEGFLQIPRSEIIDGSEGSAGKPAQQAIRGAGAVRAILHVSSLVEKVRNQVRATS